MYFIFDIIIFPFYMYCFFVCRLYIGFSFIIDYGLFFIFMFVFGDKDRDYIIIDIPLCVCFLGSVFIFFFFMFVCFGFYDNIWDSFMEISISMMIFIFYVLYVIIGFMWYGLSLTYDNPFLSFYLLFWVMGI